MENKNFNKVFKEKNMTMYKLSHITGVPYTTISEIVNGKVDINKCSVETIQRIANILNVNISDIINPIHYVKGIKGKCGDTAYKWITSDEDKVLLEIHEKGERILLDGEAKYTVPSILEYEPLCAEIIIKKYHQRKEFEKLAGELL